MTELATGTEGRRPKASRGGNRGNGYVWRCVVRYGDFGAGRTAADGGRCDAADWHALQRRLNEWRAASKVASLWAI